VSKTTYIVLRRCDNPEKNLDRAYEYAGVGDAYSARDALRKTGEKFGDGIYAVIPESRWTEEAVSTETITKVKVGS
jgi:hypothetical protein